MNNTLILDPVHKQLIFTKEELKIINTWAVQRLKYISQLGFVFQLFPGATHSRFSHSCGTFYIAKTFILHKNKCFNYTPYEKKLLCYTALLHDLGHGPYSHTFESITKINHEKYTEEIILKNKELNELLKNINPQLPNDIVSLLNNKYKNNKLNYLISSNIDFDRFDYLQRDSYYTGINFGNIDYIWIFKNMHFKNNKIIFNEKCLPEIESFFNSRKNMFLRVYENPLTIAWQLLFEKIFHRFIDLVNKNYKFKNKIPDNIIKIIMENKMKLNTMLNINDSIFNNIIFNFTNEDDYILKTLSQSFKTRNVFSFINIKNKNTNVKLINKKYKYTTLEKKYFICYYKWQIKNPTLSAFNKSPIYIELNKKIHLLQEISTSIKSLFKNKEIKKKKFSYEYMFFLKK